MKTTTLAVTGAALASVVLLGPAATAQAADGHHGTKLSKAEKKADRKHDRKVERRAEKAQVPPQDTTTVLPTESAGSIAGTSPGRPTASQARRGVVSCGVTIDKTPVGSWPDSVLYATHNTCTTPQPVALSVQYQPGPWHRGLCQEQQCRLDFRNTILVKPGDGTAIADLDAGCFEQVDWKYQGRLIASGHFGGKDCVTPPLKPPVVHPHPPILTPPAHHRQPVRHYSHIDSHKKPHHVEQLAFTGPAQYATIGGWSLLFLVVGGGLVYAGSRKRDQA